MEAGISDRKNSHVNHHEQFKTVEAGVFLDSLNISQSFRLPNNAIVFQAQIFLQYRTLRYSTSVLLFHFSRIQYKKRIKKPHKKEASSMMSQKK